MHVSMFLQDAVHVLEFGSVFHLLNVYLHLHLSLTQYPDSRELMHLGILANVKPSQSSEIFIINLIVLSFLVFYFYYLICAYLNCVESTLVSRN